VSGGLRFEAPGLGAHGMQPPVLHAHVLFATYGCSRASTPNGVYSRFRCALRADISLSISSDNTSRILFEMIRWFVLFVSFVSSLCINKTIDCVNQPVDLGLPKVHSSVNPLEPLPPPCALTSRQSKHDTVDETTGRLQIYHDE
jgi:hypothetical protein